MIEFFVDGLNSRLALSLNSLAGTSFYLDATMVLLAMLSIVATVALLLYYMMVERSVEKTVVLGISLVGSLVVSQVIGFLFYHPRPFVAIGATPLIPHAPSSSFPSDHALVLFSMVAPLWLYGNKRLSTGFLALGLATGIARVYCGLHYPLDALGSLVLGLGLGWLSWRYRREILKSLACVGYFRNLCKK